MRATLGKRQRIPSATSHITMARAIVLLIKVPGSVEAFRDRACFQTFLTLLPPRQPIDAIDSLAFDPYHELPTIAQTHHVSEITS